MRRLHDVELHPEQQGVVIDRPGVGRTSAQALPVRLAGSGEVIVGDRGERDELEVVDLDRRRATAIDASDLDLRARPEAVRDGDLPARDLVTKLCAELHPASLATLAPNPGPGR